MYYPTESMYTTEMFTEYDENYYEYDNGSVYGEVQRNRSDSKPMDYTVTILYALMFVFSLCTNVLVLVIIYLFEKLTTVTNVLLLNLVLSSLLFIMSLPFVAVHRFLSYWPFGKVMCKLVASLYYLGFYSSVLFLTVLTFDRHLAVVYSLSAQRLRSRTCALVSCVVVWLLSALACIKPLILQKFFYNMLTEQYHCMEDPWESSEQVLWSVGFYTQLLLFFLLPLLIIIYCYARITCTVLSSQIVTKFKTVRLIFIIVLLFFICWTPFNIALLMYDSASTPEDRGRWRHVLSVTQDFAHLYFCISPIFYTFVGKKFQNYFRMFLVRRFPGLKKHISVSQISRSNMSSKSTRIEL